MYTARLFALTLLTLCATSALAQTKPIVGTAPFFRSSAVTPATAAEAQALVTNVLVESDRFMVVEVEQRTAIEDELFAQGDDAYLDGVVTAVEPMGAEYLLFGTILDVSAREQVSDGTRTYAGSVTYELRKVSVGTREVECQQTIQTDVADQAVSAGRGGLVGLVRKQAGGLVGRAAAAALNADSPDAAITAAINDSRSQVQSFLDTCFPTTYEVLAIEREGDGGRIEEVLIGGDSDGLRAGQSLDVVELQVFEMSDGTVRTRERPVASLRVRDVQGEGFAVCSVRGRRDQEALRDAFAEGTTLVVKVAD
ncbi:MAG: hypothetical protein AAF089_13640 [Bacteroidota bacterium]